MISEDSLKEALAFAHRLADIARPITLAHFRTALSIDNKNAIDAVDFDPVTQADRHAETAMRALIAHERSGDGIRGEEFGVTASQNGYYWVLDPIDGTRAYIAGLPVWTTLIAFCDPHGVPLIGIIDQPVLGERYSGWPGQALLQTPDGATHDLSVSRTEQLNHAIISTTDPFILTPSEQTAWIDLRHTARLSRYGLDAYAYARLAAGSIDLVAESGLALHDMAALLPVIRGAGGVACDWSGGIAKREGQLVCAATPALLEAALIFLKPQAEAASPLSGPLPGTDTE